MSTHSGTKSSSCYLSDEEFALQRNAIFQDQSYFTARLQAVIVYEIDPVAGKDWLNRIRTRPRLRRIVLDD
jgi:hypothetical protein